RAMPLFKQGKYELGMSYLDRAVALQPDRWQDYRAFIKCIFAKTYRAAIEDFQDCKVKFGNNYVMDHSYDFYIALCYLQLNEFQQAEQMLKSEIEQQGENVHYLDLFYYGISKYEQGRYEEAVETFDEVLGLYPQFSDVQYYKAICLSKIDRRDEVKTLLQEAKRNADEGYTINEDNAIYERYPYQVRW
ncbi:MAG: tetratricopeptide repeat protein, partial [Bacteroidota bacterium]